MDSFAFDLLQGAGIAAAIGIRPFLPLLLVGALAAFDLGIDFDGTDFAFLEQAPALAIVLVLMAISTYAVRRGGPAALEVQPWIAVFGAFAVALGMLQGAASLADHDHPILAGHRRRRGLRGARLRRRARSAWSAPASGSTPTRPATLTLYAEGAGLVAAGISVLFPPLAVLVIGALIALLLGGRRRAGEKYAGLRILR